MSADKPFVLAVPSKGRLQENAFAFFARAGLKLVQGGGSRDYRGRLAGFDGLEIAFKGGQVGDDRYFSRIRDGFAAT